MLGFYNVIFLTKPHKTPLNVTEPLFVEGNLLELDIIFRIVKFAFGESNVVNGGE